MSGRPRKKSKKAEEAEEIEKQIEDEEPDLVSAPVVAEQDIWIQCDRCDKWRRLPPSHAHCVEADQWFCENNPDMKYNSCTIPAENWEQPAEVADQDVFEPDEEEEEDDDFDEDDEEYSVGSKRRAPIKKPVKPTFSSKKPNRKLSGENHSKPTQSYPSQHKAAPAQQVSSIQHRRPPMPNIPTNPLTSPLGNPGMNQAMLAQQQLLLQQQLHQQQLQQLAQSGLGSHFGALYGSGAGGQDARDRNRVTNPQSDPMASLAAMQSRLNNKTQQSQGMGSFPFPGVRDYKPL